MNLIININKKNLFLIKKKKKKKKTINQIKK